MYKRIAETPCLTEAAEVVNRAFPGIPPEQVESETRDHLGGTIYSHYLHEKLIGFSTYAVGKSVLYLAGIALDPAAHGQGIARNCMQTASQEHDRQYIALVTQNPCMARSLLKVGPEVAFSDLERVVQQELYEASGMPNTNAPLHIGRYPANSLYGPAGPMPSSDPELNARFEILGPDTGHLFVVETRK